MSGGLASPPGPPGARITPYEVGIPGRAFAERTFERIREEAEVRSIDATDPGAFVLLGEVGLAVREIQGEERGGEALERYAAFLFHAFHFRRAGEPLYVLEEPVARRLVGASADAFGGWAGELPAAAGYLQLPKQLFWSRPDDDPAEPLDGIFWTRSHGDTLSLLVALGMGAHRPGISVVDLPPLPLADAPRWPREEARGDGHDFETTLPGGELDRLYSVVTLAEVLKLAARAFAYVASEPGAVGESERVVGGAESVVPLSSALPFRRIRLVEGAG